MPTVLRLPPSAEHHAAIEATSRANGYLETSFLPGRCFASPADFNTQLDQWLERANRRVHRRLQARPVDRIDAERQAMVASPPVSPVVDWRLSTRLARDHYVRLDANDYSVHPSAIGRRVDIHADADHVEVFCDSNPVAGHARCWASHQSITDPMHRDAATLLRAAHRLAVTANPIRTEFDHRDLADYDHLFGLDSEVA